MPPGSPFIDPSDTPAIAQLLTGFYPQTFRLAAGLTSDIAAAETLSREILQRSLRQLWRWKDLADAERWFPHMAVLLAREHLQTASRAPTSPDALQNLARATAMLSPQQREAVLLHYGEGFNPRQVATAMDCSATAASNHLDAALRRLAPIAGEHLGTFLQALPQMLASIVPPPGDVRLRVEQQLRRSRWIARLRRAVRGSVTLAVLAAAVFLAIHFRHLFLG